MTATKLCGLDRPGGLHLRIMSTMIGTVLTGRNIPYSLAPTNPWRLVSPLLGFPWFLLGNLGSGKCRKLESFKVLNQLPHYLDSNPVVGLRDGDGLNVDSQGPKFVIWWVYLGWNSGLRTFLNAYLLQVKKKKKSSTSHCCKLATSHFDPILKTPYQFWSIFSETNELHVIHNQKKHLFWLTVVPRGKKRLILMIESDCQLLVGR